MLYTTYIQIGGRTTREKHLIITAMINADRDEDMRYEFTDLDTGEQKEILPAVLRDALKDTVIRRFDTSYVRRRYAGVKFIEKDRYEDIMIHLDNFGYFPFHLISETKSK